MSRATLIEWWVRLTLDTPRKYGYHSHGLLPSARETGGTVPERNLGGSRVSLEGVVDMHVHFGPEPLVEQLSNNRHSVDPIELAREAAAAGMRAVVLKAHEFASTMTAYLVRQVVPSVEVFGGICCDHPVGGLNPAAVETALMNGARIVWLPTISSTTGDTAGIAARLFGVERGISLLTDDGDLVGEVKDIMDLVSQYDAILATGHITTAEHFATARAYGRRGRLIVTHAMQEGFGPQLSEQECRELADLGATIEFSAGSCMSSPPIFGKVVSAVQAITPDNVLISSDYGWSQAVPKPAPGYRGYLDALWEAGVPEATLRTLACDNPSRLLRLAD